MKRFVFAALTSSVIAATGGAAYLGPPGICNTIECGEAASAVETTWKGVSKSNLVEKLPGVLDEFAGNTTARMEILRRASFTEAGEPVAERVVGVLALRALERAGEKNEASALFDVGYMIHLYHTLGVEGFAHRGERQNIAGYAFVSRAIELGGDAGMQVGAAYMTLPAMQPRVGDRVAKARELFRAHTEAALKACPPGSAEEKNVAFVLGIEGETVDAVRARLTKASSVK